MKVDGIQTGGYKVDQLRWNNQLLYRREIETLPFTTHVLNASDVNIDYTVAMEENIRVPNKYLDFSGLQIDENLYNEAQNYTYYRRFRRVASNNTYFCAGIRVNHGGGFWKAGPIIYFKILIPEGQSVQVDWLQAGTSQTNYINYGTYGKKIYFFWSNYNLIGADRRSGLNYNYVESGKTFSANAHMPENFHNSDSLFQYYREKGIIHTPSFPVVENYWGDMTEWDASNGWVEDEWCVSSGSPHVYRMTLTNTSNQTLPYYIYFDFASNLYSGKSTDYYTAGFQNITITKLEDTE